ncbi:MAG: histidine--tRNA ligase [Oscillospiraceae bacterium]|jgi:histidyl-tRNA synthetase|nr:histidine--tRNA ligase [Oscillospiraceae bacterium]
MAVSISRPRGTADITPEAIYKWHFIESVAAGVARDFGFREIRFPTFEYTELFQRGVGDTTDVVQKEMYTFEDKGGRSITLRPEGTASAVRANLENSVFAAGLPVKEYYVTSIYRYDKPGMGRYREHHQFGVELFGSEDASSDAEVITLGAEYLRRLGVNNVRLEINSIGCPNCRPKYMEALKEYFNARIDKLCDTCRERLERNPLRILDCKSEICRSVAKDAPSGLEFLCGDCVDHFEKLKKYLNVSGLEFTVNSRIVRGLDYYTRTVFEFLADGIGGLAVIGGGRYDGLVSTLGGSHTPGLGFGSGIERMLLAMDAERAEIEKPGGVNVFIAAADNNADELIQKLVNELRKLRISAERDIMGRSLKAQLKYADRSGALYSLVIGGDEIASGHGTLKPMRGNSESVSVELNAAAIAKSIRYIPERG